MDASGAPLDGQGRLQKSTTAPRPATPRSSFDHAAPSYPAAGARGATVFEDDGFYTNAARDGVTAPGKFAPMRSVRCGRCLAFSSAVLGCAKAAPLVYMLQYYIPSQALSVPCALQTCACIAGSFAATAFLAPTSRVVAPIWLACALFDAAVTATVMALALPIAHALVSEPDGTDNVYLAWTLRCFWAYSTLGVLSAGLALAGIVQRCKQPRELQERKAEEQADALLWSRHDDDDGYFRDVDAVLRGSSYSRAHQSRPACQSRAYEVRWCIVPALVCLTWACYAIVAGVLEIITATRTDPPGHARPGAAPPNARSKSKYEGCDPLVPFACALPFPSSFYTRGDSKSKYTGRRIELRSSVPSTRWELNAERTTSTLNGRGISDRDGFSTVSPILFALSAEVATSSLVQASNISMSTRLNASSTFLIDAVTGELVPHFCDKDFFDPTFGLRDQWPEDERRLLVLQPAQSLRFNRKYVVAVVSQSGGMIDARTGNRLIPPQSGAFAALRDKTHSDPEFDHRRAEEFDQDVWPVLEGADISRSNASLMLAWSFSTTSRQSSLGRFERIRDRALMATSEQGPEHYAITTVVDESEKCGGGGDHTGNNFKESGGRASSAQHHQHIAKTLHGHFMAPNYLITPGPAPRSRFVWRREGEDFEVQNGESQVNFLIRIPCSVWNESRPASMVLQYGHGLFGSRKEAEDAYLGAMADEYGHIVIATDWKGMSKYDIPMALRIFTKCIGEFSSMPERTQQGWIDNQLFLRLVKGRLAGHADFTTISGLPVLPKGVNTTTGYYGNSQGSVIGGGYFSSSKDLRRAVLGVPGAPFALLLSRSKDFAPYHAALRLQAWTAVDLRIFLSLMQLLWDPAESGGWLGNVVDAEEHGYPPKRVLLQAALGDAQVTTVAAELMARTFQASTIQPQTRYVFGVPERPAPWHIDDEGRAPAGVQSNNAIVEYLYDDAPPVRRDRDVPPTDGKDTHECPRRERRAQKQLDSFLVHGVVMQPCDEGKICESKTCPRGDSDN